MQGRGKGDWTDHSEWSSSALEKAARNQPLLLEVVQAVTEGTCGLVGLLLWALLHTGLIISNPLHLWMQEMDSGPLRIKNVALLGRTCRRLSWGSPAGQCQRYQSLPALFSLCTLTGLGTLSCSRYSATCLWCMSMVGTVSVKTAP